MDLNERLHILVSGKVITEDIAHAVRRVIERFTTRWGIELNEEKGGRMVTHLAMALMRIKQKKEISPLEDDHFDEFRSSEYFSRSVEITDDICGWTPLCLPEAERQYLIINICLILDDLNEG
ncbi:MAG: PRD domain-containing protein [Treponema sp.]|jgi:transcriptional regulatory protein LevR|nr:PRD domain-containing protein [Treponema sp.]